MSENTKILIIGIDGGTFDIIMPMVEKNKLLHFSKLIKNGAYGYLNSTIPPASVPAWQSFMTGKNPGKHGIFDFMKRVDDDYYGTFVTSRDLKSKTLWKMASLEGKDVVVIGITGTYPPEKVRGVLITGMMTPDGVIYTHPPELTEFLNKKNYKRFINAADYEDKEEFYRAVLEMEEIRKDIAIHLMRNIHWDLFVTMILGTDTVQHELWGNRELIENFYKEVDEIVGALIDEAGEDAYVVIVSDHGFGELRKFVNLNWWLHRQGYLKYKKGVVEESRYAKVKAARGEKTPLLYRVMYRAGITQERLLKIIRTLKLERLISKLPAKIKEKAFTLPQSNIEIDWSETKAYLSSFLTAETQSVMINLKGRDPQGCVPPEDYEITRSEIINGLKDLRDPSTGEKVIINAFRREEIYHGPYVKDAPDIILQMKDGYKLSTKLNPDKLIEDLIDIFGRVKGSHRQYGIFIAYGPDIKKGVKVEGVNIVDIAPTVMHILGLPIPEDMDGRVLTEIFREGSEIAMRKPKFVPPEYYDKKEEMERIKERARRLRKRIS